MVTKDFEMNITPSQETKGGTLKLYLTRNPLFLALFFYLTSKSASQAQTVNIKAEGWYPQFLSWASFLVIN